MTAVVDSFDGPPLVVARAVPVVQHDMQHVCVGQINGGGLANRNQRAWPGGGLSPESPTARPAQPGPPRVPPCAPECRSNILCKSLLKLCTQRLQARLAARVARADSRSQMRSTRV